MMIDNKTRQLIKECYENLDCCFYQTGTLPTAEDWDGHLESQVFHDKFGLGWDRNELLNTMVIAAYNLIHEGK